MVYPVERMIPWAVLRAGMGSYLQGDQVDRGVVTRLVQIRACMATGRGDWEETTAQWDRSVEPVADHDRDM